MKNYFTLFLFLMLFASGFSQHNGTRENALNNDAINEARKNWDTFLDYTIEHPEININPNLQLQSYQEVDTDVRNFLSEPIDSLQLIPVMYYSEEAKIEMQKDNYEVQSSIKLIPFSDLSLAKQYDIIGDKFYRVTKALNSGQELKLIKLKWKYYDDHFHTLCLATDNEIGYNVIISNLKQYIGSATSK